MCEFCVTHGEGKKWYLDAKNYEKELWHADNDMRTRFATVYHRSAETDMFNLYNNISGLLETDPSAASAIMDKGIKKAKSLHWQQVVPLEDAKQIVDICNTFTRIPCICRWINKGVSDNRTCYLVTRTPEFIQTVTKFPDFEPPSDLDNLTGEVVKKDLEAHDAAGLVHTIGTFGSPFIGAICNCDTHDCLGFGLRRLYASQGKGLCFKAEYVAQIDNEKCTGCRECKKSCPFGAIFYGNAVDKCLVHQKQCYGCGICRAVCPTDAITLLDRNAIPILANDW